MNLEIYKTLTTKELNECEYISTFDIYKIYVYYGYETFLIAINNSNLICGCFEFHEIEDGYQLAHMYVIPTLKGKGIGKTIISEAVKLFETFRLPSTNSNDTYYYIEDGLGFIHSCFDDGILVEPPFKRPEEYVVI